MFAFRSPATVYINICGSIASYIFIHSEFETAKKNTCFCYAANYANRLNQQKRNIDKHKETEECVEMKGL